MTNQPECPKKITENLSRLTESYLSTAVNTMLKGTRSPLDRHLSDFHFPALERALDSIPKSSFSNLSFVNSQLEQTLKIAVPDISPINRQLEELRVNMAKLPEGVSQAARFSEMLKILSENIKSIVDNLDEENRQAFETEAEKLGADVANQAFAPILDLLEKTIPEDVPSALRKLLVYIFLAYLAEPVASKQIQKAVIEPNTCIVKQGCVIRADGSKQSKRKAAIPIGAQVSLIDKGGNWKKIKWEKEDGEVIEGWIRADLLEPKYLDSRIEDFFY